jgi:hypothetical protein
MLYRITNTGEARTVDFLAVFAEGETKEFNETEIKHWAGMYGVPPVSALPDGFDVEFVGEDSDKNEGEEG